MTESEILDYIDNLQEWDNNAFGMILLNVPDSLMQQLTIQVLREKAVEKERWVSADEFGKLYQEALKKAIEGRGRKILTSFEPFEPFERF